MTIFDPISGRQITVDLSGKPYRSIVQQECFTGEEEPLRAGQALRAEELKSPDAPSQRDCCKHFKARDA